MRHFICIFLLFVCLHSCREAEKKGPSFDIEKFKANAEVILNQIPGWEIKLKIKLVEEYTKDQYVSQERQMAYKCLRYDFISEKHTLFYIREMRYYQNNQYGAMKVLRKLGASGDETPGLTYTNDFVMRKDNRIFWLNTACGYSWRNHTLLVRAFKDSFYNGIENDTISCHCGFNCD